MYMTCCVTYSAAGSATFFPRVAFAMNSSVGHPCCHCQRMWGRKMRPAAAPPAQMCQDRNTRHRRPATRPATTPKARNSTLILFCSPMPATSPNSSHGRESSVRRARAETSHKAAQNRMSNAFIERIPQIPIYAGASAVASAAANCA